MRPIKITITPSADFATLGDVLVRRWDGITPEGVRCHVYVATVAVHVQENSAEFEAAIIEIQAPREFRPGPERN